MIMVPTKVSVIIAEEITGHAKRYDRSPTVFLSAIMIGTSTIFWLYIITINKY